MLIAAPVLVAAYHLLIGRGLTSLDRAKKLGGASGPYVLQAEIAACHARARTPEDTDWARIVKFYDALAQLTPSPIIELNRAYPDGYLSIDGSYSDFLEKREAFLAAQAAREQSLASQVRREIEWLKRGAKARTTKSAQ